MHRAVLWDRQSSGRPFFDSDRFPSCLFGFGFLLTLWPDSQDRLARIHPYLTAQDALRRDGERIARDMQAVLMRQSRPGSQN
jgi:hypothetical protein